MNYTKPSLPTTLLDTNDLQLLFENEDDLVELSISECLAVGIITKNASLGDSQIVKTDMSYVDMKSFEIDNCRIISANLASSKFHDSVWRTVSVEDSRMTGLQAQNSTFKNIEFLNSKIDLVNFRFTTMENITFDNCVMYDADFYGATLKNVSFIKCSISKINFSTAKIKNVDLSESKIEGLLGVESLRGVTINYDQMLQLAPYFAHEAGIKIK